VASAFLQIVDWAQTAICDTRGWGSEANPFVVELIQNCGIAGFFIPKLLFAFILLGLTLFPDSPMNLVSSIVVTILSACICLINSHSIYNMLKTKPRG